MARFVDIGVDLGTTVTKAVALDDVCRPVSLATVPTGWTTPRPGWSEREPRQVAAVVDRLLAQVVASAGHGLRVRSIGFCSIGETGVLLDASGEAHSPMIAWHDPRGAGQMSRLPDDVRAALPARTGLPASAVATLAKLLWLREDTGTDLRRLQWLSVPEFVCHRLGAGRWSERSMLGRTACWDIHDDGPWAPALDVLGAGPALLPPAVPAGAALGRVRGDHPVAAARGAVLTVAGHDHLVAAAALGAGAHGRVCDSIGTAEAFVAALAAPPPPDDVARLVGRGLTVYPHVVEGTACLLGALRTGLVLATALDRLGVTSPALRDRLDRRAVEAEPASGVVVEGLAMDDDHVAVRWPGDADPPRVWRAVLARVRAVLDEEVAAVRATGIAVDEVVVTGGWSHLSSVLASRSGLAARVTRVTLEEPGAVGAALSARWASRHPAGSDPTTHRAPPASWFTRHA